MAKGKIIRSSYISAVIEDMEHVSLMLRERNNLSDTQTIFANTLLLWIDAVRVIRERTPRHSNRVPDTALLKPAKLNSLWDEQGVTNAWHTYFDGLKGASQKSIRRVASTVANAANSYVRRSEDWAGLSDNLLSRFEGLVNQGTPECDIKVLRVALVKTFAQAGVKSEDSLRVFAGRASSAGTRYKELREAAKAARALPDRPDTRSFALNRLGQITLKVADVDRAEEFYRDKLGLSHVFRCGVETYFDCQGVRLKIEEVIEADEIKRDGPLCFTVVDIKLAVRELEAREVTFLNPRLQVTPMEDRDLWMACFSDPDDHPLALMQEVPKDSEPPEV